MMNYEKILKADCIDAGMALVLINLLIANVFFSLPTVNYIAIALLILTMSIPLILKPFAYLWFNFSHLLGAIVSKVLLSIIFFSIVTPIGLLVKIIRKDTLHLDSFKKSSESVFKIRNHLFIKKDLQYPY